MTPRRALETSRVQVKAIAIGVGEGDPLLVAGARRDREHRTWLVTTTNRTAAAIANPSRDDPGGDGCRYSPTRRAARSRWRRAAR